MKIHNFSKTPFQEKHIANKPFAPHPCESLKAFKQLNPGRYIQQPENYENCRDGFSFYRKDDGQIIGLSDN